MEETKRDSSKPKRPKLNVENIVKNYLQRRNYSTKALLVSATADEYITNSVVEKSASRPDSILYSCCNSDVAAIVHNFAKVLTWSGEATRKRKECHDIEQLLPPLFCHLYLDILKGGHEEHANAFLAKYSPAIADIRCDETLRTLLSGLRKKADVAQYVHEFRQNKYRIELTARTLVQFKKFIAQHCHVIILHSLQAHFDVQEKEDMDETSTEKDCLIGPDSNNLETSDPQENESNGLNDSCMPTVNSEHDVNGENQYFTETCAKLQQALSELADLPENLLTINISNTKEIATCGVMKRCYGLMAYNQFNTLHLRPVNTLDPIVAFKHCEEIKLNSHSDQIYDVVIGNRNIITVSGDKTACVYDLMDMCLIKKCQGHIGPVYCVALSSNDCYFVTGSQDTTARLWDIVNCVTVRVFAGHSLSVICVDFHPNCLYVVTGSADRTMRLWSIENANILRLFCDEKNGVVYNAKISPIGDVLASVGDDKKIKLWSIAGSKVCREIKSDNLATKAVWSHDGRKLCTSALNGVVEIWENPLESEKPTLCNRLEGKVLALEFCFDTFACITTK